ncbi:type II secretory pathway, component PulK [Idiomarina sp. A28L]|uniref:type II secretion system minor pseudopilin GspK n=1 Tax=Idiomarina sp. A28L TaxID=1036674 RepID=UPI0002138E01|nr:type II secretion system minor pseudopilin GspK [Idiomarina sp. A28L]EGN74715.1 type II secretory pathway, component PulK [Idiomarina sp. A28L]
MSLRAYRRSRGFAIITVLLVVALIAVLAMQMSGRLRMQVARIASSDYAEQAYWHWMSAEALVRQVLLVELAEDEGHTNLSQNWAIQQGPFPVRGGLIAGRIRDLHSCFNLNSLYTDDPANAQFLLAEAQYRALLSALEVDEFAAERLTSTLIDWLDKNRELHSTLGAEDPDYESLPQPYQAANNLLSHVSELRQILGYNRDVYQLLKPYVCVIPGVTEWKLNLNTVSETQPEIVMAFFRGQLDMNAAEGLIANRPEEGYVDVDAIRQQGEIQNLVSGGTALNELNQLTVASEYFELQAQVQYGDLEYYGFSQLRIMNGSAHVLHRSRGGYEQDE